MGTKKKSNLKFVFANNLPKTKVEAPAPSVVPDEPPVEEIPVEPIVPEPILTDEPAPEEEEEKQEVNYKEYRAPIGTPENGIILCVILSLITILALGFLICYEHTWHNEEQQNSVVDVKFTGLQTAIKNCVSEISDPNKREYCTQLREVYLEAAKSTKDIDSIEKTIRDKSREILGFENPKKGEELEYEYEWQELLGPVGVINTWLATSNIVVTKDNQREVFTAIAKGFE